jgi:hypothetical protein
VSEPRENDDQRELAELIRSVDVCAPPHLHARVQAMVDERSHAGRRAVTFTPLRAGAAAVLAAAIAAVVLVVSLSGGGAGMLSQASALTLAQATMRAPGPSPVAAGQLTANVEGTAFPAWGEHFGWRASGARVDRLDGRAVTTVFYRDPQGRRIGYAIVAGSSGGAASASGTAQWRGGVDYRLTREHGAEVVAWVRDGHLCVISGADVPGATLLALAGSTERGLGA